MKPHDDRLRDLIDLYVDARIDEEQLVELEKLLRDDPAARDYFVRYSGMNTQLHLDARAEQAGEASIRAVKALELVSPNRFRRIPSLAWAASIVATFVLAAVVWRTFSDRQSDVESARIAWLVNAQDCRWREDSASPTDFVAGCTIALQSGLAELHFRSGAKLVLEGPIQLQLLAPDKAQLFRGRLTAEIPQEAIGFQVVTPAGRVVDLGTAFGISVDVVGDAEVVVFEGEVEAHDDNPATKAKNLRKGKWAKIDGRGVLVGDADRSLNDVDFIRQIEPAMRYKPQTMTVDFREPKAGTIQDATGKGTGLPLRLPGTGEAIPPYDTNLRLHPSGGRLELTATNSDINRQYQLDSGEYLGMRLSELGFTGEEDFEVSATFLNIPAMEPLGQFGLFVGLSSEANIRGGLIAGSPNDCTQFLVNNCEGRDRDLHNVGVVPNSSNVTVKILRRGGKYNLTVLDRSNEMSTSLTTRHPAFLDGADDLYVGLFGAGVRSTRPRTLIVKDFQAMVWAEDHGEQ